MADKLSRHLCLSFWRRKKKGRKVFDLQNKSSFQTPLLSNTCAQRRRKKTGRKTPKLCSPARRKAPNINDLSCKVWQLCMESWFAPCSFIKERIPLKKTIQRAQIKTATDSKEDSNLLSQCDAVPLWVTSEVWWEVAGLKESVVTAGEEGS